VQLIRPQAPALLLNRGVAESFLLSFGRRQEAADRDEEARVVECVRPFVLGAPEPPGDAG
jgi:hypothetical protein